MAIFVQEGDASMFHMATVLAWTKIAIRNFY